MARPRKDITQRSKGKQGSQRLAATVQLAEFPGSRTSNNDVSAQEFKNSVTLLQFLAPIAFPCSIA
jgi:hypothetical protein